MSKNDQSKKQLDPLNNSSNKWLKTIVDNDHISSFHSVEKEPIATEYHNQSIDKDPTFSTFFGSSIISSNQQVGFNSTQMFPK
ncbi:unnamed protein product [Cunninghamella blakesleeana]